MIHPLLKCAEHVVHNRKFPKSCCSKLIDTGPDCHVALVEGENHFFKDNKKGHEQKRITVRGDELWNKCEKLVPPSEDKDYPRLPERRYRPNYREFLEGCARKVTEKCAKEVVYSIFEKRKEVDKKCCMRLVNMGKECHDALVEALDNLGKYEKKRKEVKENSGRVWKHCEEIVKN
ncbi:hypothetical protein CASFOL_011831 [Castilleja foliolosa]|uniref:Prolamin-like domain-containing protein n=1 Tax=Castilleja foliolosa TaxID=1961234 RepID=A0ABD3DSQ9_9LAMI